MELRIDPAQLDAAAGQYDTVADRLLNACSQVECEVGIQRARLGPAAAVLSARWSELYSELRAAADNYRTLATNTRHIAAAYRHLDTGR